MNTHVEVQGWEILALHKLLLDYKFDMGRRDELFASELLANLAHRLLDGLVALDDEVQGIESRDRWLQFLTVDDAQHPAAQKVLEAMNGPSRAWWQESSVEDRAAWLRAAFSPHLPSDGLLAALSANDLENEHASV